ncbi:hypothetical protein OF83DRAFT_307301 [Amylostereum chailletii]|nr:hypothetical protein OF83DRAFT_307301 [Amylostereum chailletii]
MSPSHEELQSLVHSQETSDVEAQHPRLRPFRQRAQRPPLLVKLTGYRLLNTAIIVGLGIPKAVLAYRGETAATTLDWVLGVAFAVLMYWVGLLEGVDPPVARWFFHVDYAYGILFCARTCMTAIITFACVGSILAFQTYTLYALIGVVFAGSESATAFCLSILLHVLASPLGPWPIVWIGSLLFCAAEKYLPRGVKRVFSRTYSYIEYAIWWISPGKSLGYVYTSAADMGGFLLGFVGAGSVVGWIAIQHLTDTMQITDLIVG